MKRLFCIGFGVTLSVFLLCAVAYALGVRLNTTPSIPVGVYQLTDDPIVKGSYVYFCPPPAPVFDMAKERGYIGSGYCPGGYGHLMKKTLATKGDDVVIGADGVHVNGLLLPLSVPAFADGAGRPLPKFETSMVLGSDEFLLMADNNGRSFDGRYFGTINRTQIEGVIHPVLTW
jgi:conjugative transfer signal peptidase TraF